MVLTFRQRRSALSEAHSLVWKIQSTIGELCQILSPNKLISIATIRILLRHRSLARLPSFTNVTSQSPLSSSASSNSKTGELLLGKSTSNAGFLTGWHGSNVPSCKKRRQVASSLQDTNGAQISASVDLSAYHSSLSACRRAQCLRLLRQYFYRPLLQLLRGNPYT